MTRSPTPIGKSLCAPIGLFTADLLLRRATSLEKRTAILGSARWGVRCNVSGANGPMHGRGGRAYRRQKAIKADLGHCRHPFTCRVLP